MENQEQNKQLIKNEDRVVEYTPLGADEMIKISVGMVKTIIAVKSKSGAMPTDRDCFNFLMLCKSRALNPFEGDAFLLGYDMADGTTKWTLITAYQAFLKRAEINPAFDGMESGVVVQAEDGREVCLEGDYIPDGFILKGGWARLYRKDRKIPIFKKLKLSTYSQPFGRWKIDAAGMIVKCAEADASRTAFPTKLGGCYLQEEVGPGESRVVAPVFPEENKLPESSLTKQLEGMTPAPKPEPKKDEPVEDPFAAPKQEPVKRKIRKGTFIPEQEPAPEPTPAAPTNPPEDDLDYGTPPPQQEPAPAAVNEPPVISPVDELVSRFSDNGISEQQVIDYLHSRDTIPKTIKTLGGLQSKLPNIFKIIEDRFEALVDTIKK